MYDVAIVGGGPAGLSAALMLGRCRRTVIVIDGGKPRNAAAREFHGFIGRDATDPKQLLADARREIHRYGVELLDDSVTGAESLSDPATSSSTFKLQTLLGRAIECRKLLLATGLYDQLPDWNGAAECYGITVHHCPYCDAWEHRDRHLLSCGDSSSAAVGLARLLRSWSDRVTVLTSGAPLDGDVRKQADRCGLTIVDQPVSRILHHNGRLYGVEFQGGHVLEADALFFNTAARPQSDLPHLLGCVFEDAAIAHSGRKQTTNVPGLFLAGDADGDAQFVVVAAGEGTKAAVTIHAELMSDDERR